MTEKEFVSKFQNSSVENNNKINKNIFDLEIPQINPHKYSSSVSKSNEYFRNSKNIIQNSENNMFEPQTSTDNTDQDPNSLNHHLIKSFYPNDSIDVEFELNCDTHTSCPIKYWDDENKLLLCDKCVSEHHEKTNTFNLNNFNNSIPLIFQKIKKTINDINDKNKFLKCKKIQLNYQNESWQKTTEFYQKDFKIDLMNFQKLIQMKSQNQKTKIENYFKNKNKSIDDGINLLNQKEKILKSFSQNFQIFSSKMDMKEKIKKYCGDISVVDKELQNINFTFDSLQNINTGKCTANSESENKIVYNSNLLEFYKDIQLQINKKIKDVEKIISKEKKNLNIIHKQTSKSKNNIDSPNHKLSDKVYQFNNSAVLNSNDNKNYYENSSLNNNNTNISNIIRNSKESVKSTKGKKNMACLKQINKKFSNISYIKNQEPQSHRQILNRSKYFKKSNSSKYLNKRKIK